MVQVHNLGFPRIGKRRELKFALESYWHGETTQRNLQETGQALRKLHWQYQQGLDWVPVGDFSFYDQVLDMSFTLGLSSHSHLVDELDQYFRLARGRSAGDGDTCQYTAGEMTKWFDTNYHYIVPEFDTETGFKLNPTRLVDQLKEAAQLGLPAKPVLIGPVTYLWLGKCRAEGSKLDLLQQLIPVYEDLLNVLAEHGAQWVQLDEPILVTELDAPWRHAFDLAYHRLKHCRPKILIATYFGRLQENLKLAVELPVAGLHVDAVSAREEVGKLIDWLPPHKIISLGVVSGRNIWKTDLTKTLDWLEPIVQKRPDSVWLAPSCSLLHVPIDLNSEKEMNPEIKSWLAFALQKVEELQVLGAALNHGRGSVSRQLEANAKAIASRRHSAKVHNQEVKQLVKQLFEAPCQRQAAYPDRAKLQAEHLRLPDFPTTTIGSFPQTASIRQARQKLRIGDLNQASYEQLIKKEIEFAILEQERLGLDVLVHGEAERNDMVEYFGEQLEGFVFSRFGWVQSYGSRCVKPPIIYGDVSRPVAMTVEWIRFAQSLTEKPVKGMLTGPVTILNWSFVRDDQPRSDTCFQLATVIREEVLDLEEEEVKIIQIDEAALREGLPLRKTEWQSYLNWAVKSFQVAANGVTNETQIHTHMCYSEFNDILPAIAEMDADVITIETARSNMELLSAFEDFQYPNEIGPGVYDIHSPNIPTEKDMKALMKRAAEYIPPQRLWVNPDCGLKTRQWCEVIPALSQMVSVAKALREEPVWESERNVENSSSSAGYGSVNITAGVL